MKSKQVTIQIGGDPSDARMLGMQPKYLRRSFWHASPSPSQCLADWSLEAKPLPRPPAAELKNPQVVETIKNHPELFKIVTPINVNRFEKLLKTHPNRPFVKSVCIGLREGFWPWANTLKKGYPATSDGAIPTPSDKAKSTFLREQRDKEIALGRFSPSFGADLLPGMYAMPIRAVPKSNGNFRLVADQSLGQCSLNSMVEPHEEAFPLDNMTQLGEAILKTREKQGSRTALTLFKCDVAEAYRILPMHPCWQIKQIYTIDGERYVDRNNSFGGTRSGDLFISFMSLVVWIARTLKGVDNLLAYCDDTFGVAAAADKLYYDKYKKKFPRPQTLLLQLWDELGIPHKLEKQQFGNPLTIIGIAVECGKKKDTMSLPKDVRQGLLDELQRFIDSKADNEFTLREFRNMAGWLSWALNIFPLLRPALNNVYPEMAGRTNKNKTMPVSEAVRSDLRWAAGHLKESSGVRVMNCQGDENGAESVTAEWTPTDPNHIVYCDSTTNNIAFWIPKRSTGFVAPIPDGYSSKIIFFWEILCVTLAMDHILKKASKKRLLVYCDNKDIVLILNTLKCRPEYNGLLRQISDRLMAGDHDLRVVLSKPEENSKKIADALAKGDLTTTLRLQSNITISSFQIPKELLGAAAGLSMSTFKGLWENLRAYIPSLS